MADAGSVGATRTFDYRIDIGNGAPPAVTFITRSFDVRVPTAVNYAPTAAATIELLDDRYRRILPVWQGGENIFSVNAAGTLAGQVRVEGTPTAGVTVRLYYRPTGQMINSVFSDNSGNWSFSGLKASSNDYYVLAVDPDGGTQYNIVVYDRVSAA